MSNIFVPSERLRFVLRNVIRSDGPHTQRVLQQWYTLNVPSYMRGDEGEWRDVELVQEAT